MKIRFCAALLLAAFCVTLFSGCSSVTALQQPVAKPEITISTEPAPKSAVPDSIPEFIPEPTPAATPAATGPSRSEPVYLSKEEARNIALSHAGLSADDVTRLRVEFDFDDGVPEYEVDFYHAGFEYDYEIHAETGKIRNWDKDRDD